MTARASRGNMTACPSRRAASASHSSCSKLAEVGAVAHWSWWWVTSPLWIPWVVMLPIVAVVADIVVVREALEKRAALQRAKRE